MLEKLSKFPGLRKSGSLEHIKMKVVDGIRNTLPVKPSVTPQVSKNTKGNEVDILRLSQKMYEKENKDLEDIIRREQNRAEIFADELNFKTLEVSELKQTLESFNFLEKPGSTSAPITAENFFDSKSYTSSL